MYYVKCMMGQIKTFLLHSCLSLHFHVMHEYCHIFLQFAQKTVQNVYIGTYVTNAPVATNSLKKGNSVEVSETNEPTHSRLFQYIN